MGCELSFEPDQLSAGNCKLIMDNVSELVCLYTSDDYICIYINQAFNKTTGYIKEDLNGRTMSEFIHPDNIKDLSGAYKQACHGEDSSIKLRFKRKDDAYIWLQVKIRIIIDETGPIIMCIAIDIDKYIQLEGKTDQEQTKRIRVSEKQVNKSGKDICGYSQNDDSHLCELIQDEDRLISCCLPDNANNQLYQSEQRLELVLWAADEGFWDLNIINGKVDFNQRAMEMLGCDYSELGNNVIQWEKRIHPEDLKMFKQKINAHIEGETPYFEIEYRLQKETGNYIWVMDSGKIVECDENGKPVRLAGTRRDITRQKELEAALKESKNRYLTLVETVPLIITRLNIEGKFIWANEPAVQFFGYNICGTCFGEYFINTWDAAKFDIQSFFSEKREIIKVETSVLRKDGQIRILQWQCKAFREYGKVTGVLATALDITELRESETRLKASEKRYRDLFEKSPVGLVRCDSQGNVIDVNNCFLDILGMPSNNIPEKLNLYNIPGPILKNVVWNLSQLFGKGKSVSGELQFTTSWGIPVWVEYQADPLVDENGKIIEAIIASREISERKEAEEKIRFLSFHDVLTGVYNRAFFNQELKRLDVKRQLPLSIIIGDVNGLKLVNDAFGHCMGDKLLKTIAGIFKDSCRQEDIVARWGGDEFAILLPQTRQEAALRICENIKETCRRAAADPIQPSIALGVAAKEYEHNNISEVIQEAEARMYRNKLLESNSIRSSIMSSLEDELQQRALESRKHVERLQQMCAAFADFLRLTEQQQKNLELISRLHDIGKLGIPEEILRKPGPLSNSEWYIIKRHSEIGYRIIRNSLNFVQVADEVLAHHEKWDGTGYPKGNCGADIPFLSRILAIIDAYDVMTHDCVYKKAVSPSEALDEIRKCAGSQFDPDLAGKFIEMMNQRSES